MTSHSLSQPRSLTQRAVAQLLFDVSLTSQPRRLTQRAVAQLLFDVTHDFALGRRGERVAALRQDLHEVVGEVAAGQIQTEDGVRDWGQRGKVGLGVYY